MVIPNGITLPDESFCSLEDLEQLRHEYAPNGERLLLFVGRIVHEKGLQVLVRAMPRILADYPNTRLLVAGKNGSSLWPLAYELNVDGAITFLDFVSNQRARLPLSHCRCGHLSRVCMSRLASWRWRRWRPTAT